MWPDRAAYLNQFGLMKETIDSLRYRTAAEVMVVEVQTEYDTMGFAKQRIRYSNGYQQEFVLSHNNQRQLNLPKVGETVSVADMMSWTSSPGDMSPGVGQRPGSRVQDIGSRSKTGDEPLTLEPVVPAEPQSMHELLQQVVTKAKAAVPVVVYKPQLSPAWDTLNNGIDSTTIGDMSRYSGKYTSPYLSYRNIPSIIASNIT